MIKGIDVSTWQGNIDFGKVKASGIDFVIIRAGYGRETSQKDNCFEQNYNALYGGHQGKEIRVSDLLRP